MTKYFLTHLFFYISIFIFPCFSQQYIHPVNIPPALSGNFGELRNNHFHSGIDYKTQQAVNKPILAIEDGYVSRINVSPGGYGLALYIDHPATGHTSVYGHLNSFSKKIADYVKSKQYEQESYRVELYPEKNELTVTRGEQIALSGNTGSSGGPHLHFEIRDTRSQNPLDVLEFVPRIPDTRKPDLRGIAFYPVQGKGVVNGSATPTRLGISKDNAGNPLGLGRTISAWGRIGVGVKAYDRMNGQNNIYGVKFVRLFVDNELIYSSTMRRFSFDKTRMLNSFIDFEDWRLRNSFYMKSFIEPGNTLPLYKATNNGYIDINEEKNYRLRYELEDHAGNTLSYSFTIQGKKTPIPESITCNNHMTWSLSNSYMDYGFALTIPAGNLYTDICFSHSSAKNESFLSDVHLVNNNRVPLHTNATMWIKLTADSLVNKSQYGIVTVNNNGTRSWVGGTYKNGGVETTIRELGLRYAVMADNTPPTITPIEPANWASRRQIRIRLSDNLSGVAWHRGEINGEFVLFSHDMKSSVYTYVFDDSRLTKGPQELIFTARDGAGNVAEYRYNFTY